MPPAELAAESANSLALWLQSRRRSCDMRVQRIPRAQSKEWVFERGRIRHATGGFFSIVGTALQRDGKRDRRFDQPLIEQPEIGILGFLIRQGHEHTEVLVQSKPEPGNVGLVQAAPSVQATESNYRQRHHGSATPFLAHFLAPARGAVLADSLQSEQGTRFFGKYNRNMVVIAGPHGADSSNPSLQWFPLPELLALLARDFEVNTDARSVLVSAPWRLLTPIGLEPFARWRGRGGLGEALLRSYEAPEASRMHSTAELADRLERLRRAADFSATIVDLSDLQGWEVSDTEIAPTRPAAFTVPHFAVSTTEREVGHWDQPLVAATDDGRVATLAQVRGGVLHLLFAARPELGFREHVQYGPALQEFPGEASIDPAIESLTETLEAALGRSELLLGAQQSDEGGRFFHSIATYGIHLLPDDAAIDLGEHLAWMTLAQIEALIPRRGFFSNEARSLISMLLSYV